MREYKTTINKCYKLSSDNFIPYDNIDDILDEYDKLTLKTDYSDDRPKSANEIINDNLKQWNNLEPYSNTFKNKLICWFPIYIQIGRDKDIADYFVLKDISVDNHRAIYYKICGEYAFTLYYDGYTYMRETFSEYGEYVPCYVLPCSAKDVLEHNSTCKLKDTALLLKEIWADVKKNYPDAIEQNIWFNDGYYYHTEYYMKNKFIHFDF